MVRKIWNEKAIIEFIESLNLKFLYFTELNGHNKSRFVVQCEFGHEPYETNLNTLEKGRKAKGCPVCKKINKSKTNISKIKFETIVSYFNKHNFDVLTKEKDYNGTKELLKVKCRECGMIEEVSYGAFKKRVNKCQNCINIKRYNIVKEKCNKLNYILLDKEIHGTKSPINMICNNGHKISPTYDSFIWKDCKCEICKTISRGEDKIEEFLNGLNIFHNKHYRGFDLLYKKHLEFDFYIPQLNMAIEFDGIQHFKPVKHYGGFERFMDLKIKDGLKNEFCYFNKIKLIRIPYWKLNDIEKILYKELNLNKYE